MISEIPDDVFGGIYLDETGNLVVNVTDVDKSNINSICKTINDQKVTYNIVDKSLSYLENVRLSLVPYMKEYNIAVLDANDVTNMIDIVLYSYNDKIEKLVAQYIDLRYVNISVLPKGMSFETTPGYANDNCPPEGNYMAKYSESSFETSLFETYLYPGLRIIKGGYAYTAGPRYSDREFLTAGHAAYDSSDTHFFAAANGGIIGSQHSYVFGNNGDRLNAEMSPQSGLVLPSTNSFFGGQSTYSYINVYVTGALIEMHGAYSDISEGGILAINQSVYLADYNKTIYNLILASYTCKHGDSGAGVFSRNALHRTAYNYCFGTQSIGVFTSGSNVSSYSYFSQN
ncbi:hypothetical protein SDC9_99482 [bioreactor metagenome]|uniref:Peptidase S1 domain-containing protein n=1 Tax=bioreactor metagenome TaxID=1076179 RepID=A0A645AKA0_9ZZZZ